MIKIGVILQSTKCSIYTYNTIRDLSLRDGIEIYYLQNNPTEKKSGAYKKLVKRIKTKGLLRTFDDVFFKLITRLEHIIISRVNNQAKAFGKTKSIADFSKKEITYLNPIFSKSGLLVHYSDKDINTIKNLDLDLIIRGNALGIFKGEIINVAKEGIISFHHGDNRWNRGGPPAFWEVFYKKPSTGFIIQKLTEELDGGHVLFRGNIDTKRSYTENFINLYEKSHSYMSWLIINYIENKTFPKQETMTPFGGKLLIAPTFKQSLSYSWKTSKLFLQLFYKRGLQRKEYRWAIAFTKKTWEESVLRKGTKIKNPPNHFFADPFVIKKQGRTICYVEDYSYKKGIGCISAIELLDGKNYKLLGPIIEEEFHMSFPYIFEYDDELYMVPETSSVNSIRLYKCIEFPLKWEYQKDIMTNIKAVDSIVFEHNKKWWLLNNTSGSLELMAYYSESPISENWTAHTQNPLSFDSLSSRNGGILDIGNSLPIRCRQKQGFNAYGTGLSLAKITELSPRTYNEEKISDISADFFPNIKGFHHMHSNDEYTVYDYMKCQTRG